MDNIEKYYNNVNWETLHNELYRRLAWKYYSHTHGFDDAAAGATFTRAQIEDAALVDSYAFLDFDPNLDDMYLLKTEGRSRVHMRINQEPTADALRVIPVELIQLAAAAV